MHRTLLPSLFLAGLIVALGAHAESDPETQHRRWRQELKLSEQQSDEVRKIFAESKSKLEALRRQRKEIRDQMRERLKSVLTPEQLQKLDQLRGERHGHRRHNDI